MGRRREDEGEKRRKVGEWVEPATRVYCCGGCEREMSATLDTEGRGYGYGGLT